MNSNMCRKFVIPTDIDDLESTLKSSYTTQFRQDKFKVLITPPGYGYRLYTAKVICGKIENNNMISMYVRPTLLELLIGIALVLSLIYSLIYFFTSHGSIQFIVCYSAFVVFYIAQTLWHMKECLDSYCQWLSRKTNGSLFFGQ